MNVKATDVQVQERLASLLEFLETGMREGKAFALEQAPEIAREIVGLGRVTHGLSAVALIGLLIVMVIAWRRLLAWKPEDSIDKEMGTTFGTAGLFVAACLCMAGIAYHTTAFTKAAVAPRVFIIDYLRN